MCVQDWPPKDRFKELFPELQQDFETAVPIPSYTTASGVRNLAAHFPKTEIAPDLGIRIHGLLVKQGLTTVVIIGPKMYNALSTVYDDAHSGSTRLHLDLSDAVNVMMWASPTVDGQRGYALWHIFAIEDAPLIRRYLHERKPSDQGDPIHNQDTYLTPTMLQEMLDRYRVRPYTIRQFVGEAVFIPAGCAHQVSGSFRVGHDD